MTTEIHFNIVFKLFTREMEVNSLKFPFFIIFDNSPQFLQDTLRIANNLLLVLAETASQDFFVILYTGQIFLITLIVLEEEQNGQILERNIFLLVQFCNFNSDSSLTFSLTSLISQPASAQLRASFSRSEDKASERVILYWPGFIIIHTQTDSLYVIT